MDNLAGLISNFSTFFVKRYRLTILILIGILGVGFYTYSNILQREGFPPIEIPTVLVRVAYFVNDPLIVAENITIPLENEISELPEVERIISNTTDNFTVLQVTLTEGVDSKSFATTIESNVERSVTLPKEAQIEYQTFNAGSIDGKHDLIITIGKNTSISDLQATAKVLAKELSELNTVSEANAILLEESQTNPITGEIQTIQTDFNRIGVKEDNDLVFYDAVSVGVIKQNQEIGTLELSDSVREKVDQLIEEGLLEDYRISFGGDLADALQNQIQSLESNVFSGLIAVVVVLFFFINWRASIVTAIFIPLVFAGTFIGLFLAGFSLNVLSLFALILVLGLFVDDAIVVVEAIDFEKQKGKKGLSAISSAIKSIGIADVSGTLTTLLVFVPLAAISGVLGEFIRLIPLTVIIALSISIVIALSITPFLSNVILATRKQPKTFFNKATNFIFYGFSFFVQWLAKQVSRFVKFYLVNPFVGLLVIIISIITIVIGGFFASNLEFSIFPTPKDTDDISVSISFQEGITLQRAQFIALEIEDIITTKINNDIKSVDYFNGNTNSALIYVFLTPMGERSTSKEIVKILTESFPEYEDAVVRARVNSVGPPIEDYVFQMQIFSEDQQVLEKSTTELSQFVKDIDLSSNKIEDVKVDNLEIYSRLDGKRFAVVKAKLQNNSDSAALLEIQSQIESKYNKDTLAELSLAEDALGFDFGQESENFESFNSALLAMIISILVMYGLLLLQFDSFSQPLLVFLAIPFTFLGLFSGLYYTNNPLSFFVVIGITGLIGIVVNNTIMLLDYANQAKKDGASTIDAISEAVNIRFRPLLTTSITTVIGLLPLALTDPFWEPLAFTIIFGIISSTILVIFAFPAYYAVVEGLRDLRNKAFAKVFKA